MSSSSPSMPSDEPIAIVGMSCRFAPDIDSLEKFWSALTNGTDGVSEIPTDRYQYYASVGPRATATMRTMTRFAAFLDDVAGFDADFFGISPREAVNIDPQQRMLLELSWEALEHAGIPPLTLRESDAGVFIAGNSVDYGRMLLENLPGIEPWAVNGAFLFGLANRISYVLDLRGPSIAVDTACAGSLTVLHLACQSLWRHETSMAFVGGVNVIASPGTTIALDAAGATSPDGRSKAFDSAADGYGRGEGAGLVVLERLSVARQLGHRVLAVIRGNGVFQDGKTQGMMAPNSAAQEHMLREVYARIGLDPADIEFVEAHGTGTPAGDKAEADALAAVFGRGRPADSPCLIGSVKPNIGHLEAGAGIAGVIKTVLAIGHRVIPPSLHDHPSPEIPWAESRLKLVDTLTPWPDGPKPRRAAVSSYGVGGTLAHTVVEQAPPLCFPDIGSASAIAAAPASPLTASGDQARVFPLSARSEAGVRALADRLAAWLEASPDVPLASVAYTLAVRRSHLSWRLAIVADDRATLIRRLRQAAANENSPDVLLGHCAPDDEAYPVWVFSGHGAQWEGMGRALLEQSPEFAAAIDELGPVFTEELGFSPRQAITEGNFSSTLRVQAMTFAMQAGLVAVWQAHGIQPGAIIGHSTGEIMASVAGGALDFARAARFACRRAALLDRVTGGRMAIVSLPFAEVQRRLDGRDDLAAAIEASPQSTVVAGTEPAVEAAIAGWEDEGFAVRRVASDVAFHSNHIDPVLKDIATAGERLAAELPAVSLYTTALADPRATVIRDGKYWVANIRNPVRFSSAVEAAAMDGHRIFLEISSHPIVAHSISETLDTLGTAEDAMIASTIHRQSAGSDAVARNLADLFCHGAAVDWHTLYPAGDLADLPTMAWQHTRYWIAPPISLSAGGHDPAAHSLLGTRTTLADSERTQLWHTYLDFSCRPYPGEHQVLDTELVPASVLINTLLDAVAAQTPDSRTLNDITLKAPVAPNTPREIQVVRNANHLHLASRLLESEPGEESAQWWLTHTTATTDTDTDTDSDSVADPAAAVDISAIRDRCSVSWTWAEVDESYRRRGSAGYAFPWTVNWLKSNDGEIIAGTTTDERNLTWAQTLDAALMATLLLMPDDGTVRMPARIHKVTVFDKPPTHTVVHAYRAPRPQLGPATEDLFDVRVADETGRVIAHVEGLRFASPEGGHRPQSGPRQLVHELTWHPLPVLPPRRGQAAGTPVPGTSTVDSVLFVAPDADPVADRLLRQFEAAGVSCARTVSIPGKAAEGEAAQSAEPDLIVVVPPSPHPVESPEAAAQRCVWSLVQTAQRLINRPAPRPRLWCLTRGVRECRTETALAHAPLWGAARIIASEGADFWGGLIDLPADDDPQAGKRLLSILSAPTREDVIALSPDGDLGARLTPIDRPPARPELTCRPDATYLITGGLGELGLDVARWLAERGARRLVLAGRHGLPPRQEWQTTTQPAVRRRIDAVQALETAGVTVRVLALDIANPDQARILQDPDALGLPAIRGIVHAAGVTRDAELRNVDRPSLDDVMHAKGTGAMTIHRLFPPGTLDFLVLFSSAGQYARLTGQTAYAAANAFLDGFAMYRRNQGSADTTSLAWVTWLEPGESAPPNLDEANTRGIDSITAAEAYRSWQYAHQLSIPYATVLRGIPLPPANPRLPILDQQYIVTTEQASDDAAPITKWAELPPEELQQNLKADLIQQVADVLKLTPQNIEPKRPLADMGVDSLLSVTLRVRLNRRYSQDLSPSLLWDRPTVDAIATHLTELIAASSDEGP